MQGKVKFFSHEKKFGFIKCEDGTEIFFHLSKASQDVDPAVLLKDAAVEFDIAPGTKGPQAVNVRMA